MNRKAFLILIALLVILGGVGLALRWQDVGTWGGGDTKIGSKLFAKLSINDVTQIRLVDGKGVATLELKGQRWVVKERRDYHANYADISELLTVKLPDLKVVQTENVGPTLLPRLNLVQPAVNANKDATKDSKEAENTGTLLELSDKSGKGVASLLLGKKVIKIEDSPLPIKQEKPVGRYVLYPGNPTVLVVSDGLVSAEAKPERWLAKDFFKADRMKSLASTGAGPPWKIARSEEFESWKFADGAGQLDAGVVVAAVKALGGLTFADVAPEVKPESFDKPRTFAAETFDNLTYTIRIAKKPDGDDYYLSFSVSGEPPRTRTPEKGEKPADKEKYDKYFTEDLKRLDERLKIEKSLAGWTYVVSGKTLEPLLKERAQLTRTAEKK